MATRRRRGTKSEGEKLRSIRARFEAAVDHNDHARAEAHRAARFYHNTRGHGQWEQEDREALQNEGRPCYSFNICREKVDSFLGIYADAQRSPHIAPTGSEDKMLAEILDAVVAQVLEDANFESKAARVLKTGAIMGHCALAVEVVPHDENPRWIAVRVHRVLPFELNWDSGSTEADRSDARYFFWDRYMSKEEFARWYPDHARDFDQLANAAYAEAGVDLSPPGGYSEATFENVPSDDYRVGTWSRYYYDRHRDKARVIRYEYKANERVTYTIDPDTGEANRITQEEKREIEAIAKETGVSVEMVTVMQERVKVCEFIGSRILAEYDSPGPFSGWSVCDFVYAMDEEDGVAYGALRNLFDPQMELNKANSLLIEAIANGSAPGVVAEESAIPDEEAFREERRSVNGVAIVKDGALSSGAVHERDPYPISPAVVARAQASVELIDRISGIPSQGMQTPASQAEAATTVALRHHKAKQIVADAIANYEWTIRDFVKKVTEAVVRAMPDDQIQAILSRDSSYAIEGGVAYELGPNPQDPDGKPVPVASADLRRLKDLAWNVEMELRSENTTLRVLEFDTLLKLQMGNVPVDPEVLVEAATGSRSKQQRLKRYVEEAQRRAEAAAQAQAQAEQANLALIASQKAAEQAEKQRANMAREAIDQQRADDQRTISLLEVWERADAAEKQALRELIRLAERVESEARAQVQPSGPPAVAAPLPSGMN